MSVYESKLHVDEDGARAAGRGRRRGARVSPRRGLFSRPMAAFVFIAALTFGQAAAARAQQPTPTPTLPPGEVECLPMGQPLITLPEIVSKDGKLRGTIMLIDEPSRVPFRQPYTVGSSTSAVTAPNDKAPTKCYKQQIRQFRIGTGSPVVAPSPYGDPMPGPTLRARVGDLVQLSFINQINPGNFGDSIDRAEKNRGGGCDESAGYPKSVGDKFPDCFHGSSTGNIHFHGTHTNPNSTGDNVFIEVRPSRRENNRPVVTQESVRRSFDEFYARCEAKLNVNNPLREWPKTWGDMPNYWTAEQERLLKLYDGDMEQKYGPGVKKLWPINRRQVEQGAWPQYYAGAFPYCFRLPQYKEDLTTPAAAASTGGGTGTGVGTGRGAVTGGGMGRGGGMGTGGGMGAGRGAGTGGGQPPTSGGAGTAELGHTGMGGHGTSEVPLIMGQSPGTHWYHAHKHGSTAINVANGMTGAFIIEGDEYDEALNAFYGAGWTRSESAHVLMVNQIGVTPNLARGAASRIDKGPDFSVNGRLRPVISMKPGEVQMWRIVNGSGRAGMYFSGPPAGFQWRQLAQDGVQFQDVNYQNSLNDSFMMAAGNRVDLLVKAPLAPCKNAQGRPDVCPVLVQNAVDMTDLGSANKVTLLSVRVTTDKPDPNSNRSKFIPVAPTPPRFLKDIEDSEVTGTKLMRFASKPPFGGTPQHTIDGQQFDGEVGAVVLLNKVEEWKILNETFVSATTPGISHPFHIHINPFQVTEVFSPNDTIPDPTNPANTIPLYVFDPQAKVSPGQCLLDPFADPSTWKPCTASQKTNLVWWDVFPIPSGQTVTTTRNRIDPKTGQPIIDKTTGQPVKVTVNVPGYFKMRSRFVDYSGFYVIHCHILAHEDRGMMTIVEVAPARTPYSHH